MRTVYLMVGEFIDHIKSNLITAITMAVVSLVVIVFFSMYYFQMSKYAPFKQLNIEKGVYVASNGDRLNFDGCDEIDEVFYTYKADATVGNDYNNKILAYDSWCLDSWKCGVKEGIWFNEKIIKDCIKKGVLPIVIGANNKGLIVGDLIDIESYNLAGDFPDCCKIKCKVIGVVNDDAGVIGDNGYYYAGDMSYESIYHTPKDFVNVIKNEDGSVNKGMLILAPNEVLRSMNIELPKSNVYFVKIKDNISQEKTESIINYIIKNIDGCGVTIDYFYKESDKKMQQILLTYVPYIVTGIIIMLVSIYALTNLIVSKCSKHMAVYTIIGASRKRNYLILLGNTVGTILVSFVIFITLVYLVEYYAIVNQMAFVLISNYVSIALASYLIFGLFMCFSIYLAFRKKTTRGMLVSLHK
ncbi:MAG: hypothetical protein PUB67_01155 [Clostridiales bacterium]|nr:hypothetical protein [Clostridiales bacterium]